MNINSVQLNSYLASIAQSQTINTNTQQSVIQTDKNESDKDSYISSVSGTDTAIPCGIYNSKGLEVGTGSNATAKGTSTQQGTGGVGEDSSDSEDDTETEIVTINGITYLQITTTDENGNTTVTRTKI